MLRHLTLLCTAALCACGPLDVETEGEPVQDFTSSQQGLVSCAERGDTGYRNGAAFPITVVNADGKPVERETANAYAVMQAAAAAAGVQLVVVSGFRTMAEQRVLYACFVNCNCNNCNRAAAPGTSNHQSGHALDLNTSASGVLAWLNANGARFGFARTVPSEPWHWEWWGGGPGGGPCQQVNEDNCTPSEVSACGGFGCGCVDHQCNGGFCPGQGCSAQHAANCGAFGCGCVDGACAGGFCPGSGCTAKETLDCGKFACGCSDHQCQGGPACPGAACTLKEVRDCGGFGCNCADHQCGGGFCPGSGCTGKEASDCSAKGCGCVDHQCSGGGAQCAGTGCTARQTLDCAFFGATCSQGVCVAPGRDAGFVVDAGEAPQPPASGPVDAGPFEAPEPGEALGDPPPTGAVSPSRRPGVTLQGGCASAPGETWVALALLLGGRPRRRA